MSEPGDRENAEGLQDQSPALPRIPSPALKWVRLVVAFGVSVSIGLAPFLGTVGVPGFHSLLSLFPELPFDTTKTVIPLAAFLMGIVAVGVQFYASNRPEWSRLGIVFKRVMLLIAGALLILLIVHVMSVEQVQVETPESSESISVLLGVSRPETCKECEPAMSNRECLEYTTLSPARILSCWSEPQIRLTFLALALAYLVLMSAFGALVGVLVLQDGIGVGQHAAPDGDRSAG